MPYKDLKARFEYSREYYKRNRTRMDEQTKQWQKRHPERRALSQRKTGLKRKGLTLAQFTALSDQQSGCCWICDQKPKSGLVVDHCHTTNVFRGLLCRPCNSILGRFRDKPEAAKRLLEYLEANSLFSSNGD